MKQGLKHSIESSRVENLVKDAVEKDAVEKTRLFFCCFLIDLILLLVSAIILILHQSIFKVIITVLIEHLHSSFHMKTGYYQ